LSVDDKTRHWMYFRSTPRTDEEISNSIHKSTIGGGMVKVQQKILNGRANREFLTLDDASFELVDNFDCSQKFSNQDFYEMQSGETDFTDYHKAVEDFVKTKLGCDKIVCFHSQVRNAQKESSGGVAGYANGGPHTDSSPVSADELALQLLGNDDHSKNYQRYCYLNLWKNISNTPIQNDHLAMMDERSAVKPDDYISKDLFGDGYSAVQYGLNARHAHLHKWYYFPQMTNNEAILFKQMDSDPAKLGRLCFHMSVHDPSFDKDNDHQIKPRESIETRMMCYWEDTTKADDSSTSSSPGNSMPTPTNIHQDMIKDPEAFASELAAGISGGTNLTLASIGKLFIAFLFSKMKPFIPAFLLTDSPSSLPSDYTGNPEDYFPQFVSAIEAWDMWPAMGKLYVRNQFKNSADYDTGVQKLTELLVDDAGGYQKTKSFASLEKKAIVGQLLTYEPYLAEVNKIFGDLKYE